VQIYVLGSLEPEDPYDKRDSDAVNTQYKNDRPKFAAACRALGYALGKAHHQIRVGVSRWSKIEGGSACFVHVIQGADEAGKELNRKVRVICDVPQETPNCEANQVWVDVREKLKHVTLECRYLRLAPSGVSRTQHIDDAEAFILVGGGKSTERIGYSAHGMDKPVLAITQFGRSARGVHDDILFDAYGDSGAGGELHTSWSDEEADEKNLNLNLNRSRAVGIVDLAEKIAKQLREQDSLDGWPLFVTVATCGFLLIGWVALYLFTVQGSISASVAFFALLFISATIGTGMRVLVDYQGSGTAELRFRWLGIELAVSLMLAFGLALIYLIGGITFTGNVVALEPSSAGGGAFSTIALSMSVLGLAAGFLAPVDKLRQRLERAIEERQEGAIA